MNMKILKTILDSGVETLSEDGVLELLHHIKQDKPSISEIIANYGENIPDLAQLLHKLEHYGFISVDREIKPYPVALENDHLIAVLDYLKKYLATQKTTI